MNSLNQLRSFEPYIPIRWTVKFSNKSLNVVSDIFPAIEVTFEGSKYLTKDIQIAPGVSISINTMATPTTEVSIKFYENSTRSIYKAIKSINKQLTVGKGGFAKSLDVTITEYTNSGAVANKFIFTVQISGDLANILQQSAVAYDATIKLLVIGTHEEI